MFRCENCGNVVEDLTELTDEFGRQNDVCRVCGEENEFVEIKECDCGEYIDLDEIFCDKCKADLQRQFKRLLRENFDKEELEYIDEYVEGEYLTDIVGY